MVSEALRKLAEHWNRVVRWPLDADAIAELERQAGAQAPDSYREWLSVLGVEQDLVLVDDELGEMIVTEEQLVRHARWFAELPSEVGRPFPIAFDGAGDVAVLVRSGDGADSPVLVFDHENRQFEQLLPSFAEWVESIVASTLETMPQRPTNAEKRWSVQFCFDGDNAQGIAETLGTIIPTELGSGDWEEAGSSPAGVVSFTRTLLIDGEAHQLKKAEYAGWAAPMLTLNFEEPPGLPEEQSVIRRAQTAFAKANVGYRTMVNYGALLRRHE